MRQAHTEWDRRRDAVAVAGVNAVIHAGRQADVFDKNFACFLAGFMAERNIIAAGAKVGVIGVGFSDLF